MGFLSVFGLVLQFLESKKYFKIIKDNFVKYVIRELKKRYICKEPMFGFEFELHKICIDEKKKNKCRTIIFIIKIKIHWLIPIK